MGVSKICLGDFTNKMDGENNGKPELKIQDLGVKTPIFGNIHVWKLLPNEKTYVFFWNHPYTTNN